jgi:1-phosphatidylinositol phosphodiesterase
MAIQLENGVRFFDIRVQPTSPEDPKDDTLHLVHAVFPISLTGPKKFRHLLDEVKEFLKANPSETLVMSLKREGTGNAKDEQLSTILKDHYTNPDEWWTRPRIPTLGEARGKIVLLRRFALDEQLKGEWDGKGWGLNAENWADNTPNCTCGDVCVQDFYEVLETENIEKKIQFCCDHFERAAAMVSPIPGVTTDATNPVPPGPLFINFLSASNFWKVGCWPEKIAAKLNPAVTEFLCEKHDIGDKGLDGPEEEFPGDGGVGIVVTDWVGKDGDWDLIRCIVGMNSRLLLRQRGIGWR